MKITDIKIRFVEGVVPSDMRILDMAMRNKVHYLPVNNHYSISSNVITPSAAATGGEQKKVDAFLYIETDEDITGVAGPLMNSNSLVPIIKNIYRSILIGEDPLNTERIWDVLYRRDLYNYAGINIMAVSACDFALWDIKCKKAKLPLWRMIGGATQTTLPAYANCVGGAYKEDGSGYDLDEVARLTEWCVTNGFSGSKWYPHRGPADGKKGIDELYDLYKVIREAGGSDFKMMLDVWSSWDVHYTLKAAEKLAELDLYWIEEPLMPNMIDGYEVLRKESPIAISAGENISTRWSVKHYLDRDALDIYQPDPAWCGGISECLKMMSLISMYNKRIALHGYCVPVCVQLAAIYTANICPISEYLLYITPNAQFFYENPAVPENGFLHLSNTAGIGLDIDEDKVTRSWFAE